MSLNICIQLQLGDFSLNVDFEVPDSGVCAIYGPSGCGKTSLLRTIAGLESIDSGKISFSDEIWADASVNLPVQERRVGYVFQEPSLFPHLKVRENLEYGQKRQKQIYDQASLEELAELLDIENLLHRNVQDLSGGEQQRVAIGRALLANPQILLMDEPLASLDAARKKEILPYLERLHRNLGIPILYVSHALDEVVRLADHMILMSDGRVIDQGSVVSVIERNQLIHDLAGETFTLLQGRVVVSRSEHALTEVEVGGLLIRMPSTEVQVGQQVRLKFAARDISLSLQKAQDSSILNIFEAQVMTLEDAQHPSQKLVKIKAGEVSFTAQLSVLSCETLGLEKGSKVFAQIKAASLVQ